MRVANLFNKKKIYKKIYNLENLNKKSIRLNVLQKLKTKKKLVPLQTPPYLGVFIGW